MTLAIENPAQPGPLPPLSPAYSEVVPVCPDARMEDVGHGIRQLLHDVRQRPDYPGGIPDGMPLAYAHLRPGYTHEQVGRIAAAARDRGVDPRKVHSRYFDMSGTSAPVRDAHPGESLTDYMDYMAGTALRRPASEDKGMDLRTLYPADVPGTRFRSEFGMFDSALVALGKVHRGDIEGARQTIDNVMFQAMRWGGKVPNFTHEASLDRSQTPHISLAIEALASAYGDSAGEVLAHYAEPLKLISDFWLSGRQNLLNVPAGKYDASGRQAVLPTRGPKGEQEFVARNFSDVEPDYDTWRGLRLEGVLEDVTHIERALHGLTGEARKRRFAGLCVQIRTVCESTKDFQPSTQSADGKTLETLRATQLAPVMLQALEAHLFSTTARALRAAGRAEEATPYDIETTRIGDVLNRRSWRDVSETEGHYADTLINGRQVDALDATMCYPLLVGGITPYERAVKTANLFLNKLARPYGYLISTATNNQQWEGSPDDPQTGKLNDNRGWMSVIALAAESFHMAAMEAEAAGRDPSILLQAAAVGPRGAEGVKVGFNSFRQIREKLNVVRPTNFVDGGEYGKTEEDVQKGFGMQIGGVRMMDGRDFAAEVKNPDQSWRRVTFAAKSGGLLVPAAL